MGGVSSLVSKVAHVGKNHRHIVFVSSGNDFVVAIYRSINSLLDPILRPIRNMMPQTGAIDFSPLVLIIFLQIVLIILRSVIGGMA